MPRDVAVLILVYRAADDALHLVLVPGAADVR